MPRTQTPPCPNCGFKSHWIRCGMPDKGFVVHSYECVKCHFIHTVVEEDPAKQAEGWLRGELKRPS